MASNGGWQDAVLSLGPAWYSRGQSAMGEACGCKASVVRCAAAAVICWGRAILQRGSGVKQQAGGIIQAGSSFGGGTASGHGTLQKEAVVGNRGVVDSFLRYSSQSSYRSCAAGSLCGYRYQVSLNCA